MWSDDYHLPVPTKNLTYYNLWAKNPYVFASIFEML